VLLVGVCAVQMEKEQSLQRLLSQGSSRFEEEGESPFQRPTLPWLLLPTTGARDVSGEGGAREEGAGGRHGCSWRRERGGGGNLALPRPLGALPWSPEEDAELLAFVEDLWGAALAESAEDDAPAQGPPDLPPPLAQPPLLPGTPYPLWGLGLRLRLGSGLEPVLGCLGLGLGLGAAFRWLVSWGCAVFRFR